MSDTAERIEQIHFDHQQAIEALEDKLFKTENERDTLKDELKMNPSERIEQIVAKNGEVIKALTDKLIEASSRYDLLNDQNVSLAQSNVELREKREFYDETLHRVIAEHDATVLALSALVSALTRGGAVLPALTVARAVLEKRAK